MGKAKWTFWPTYYFACMSHSIPIIMGRTDTVINPILHSQELSQKDKVHPVPALDLVSQDWECQLDLAMWKLQNDVGSPAGRRVNEWWRRKMTWEAWLCSRGEKCYLLNVPLCSDIMRCQGEAEEPTDMGFCPQVTDSAAKRDSPQVYSTSTW